MDGPPVELVASPWRPDSDLPEEPGTTPGGEDGGEDLAKVEADVFLSPAYDPVLTGMIAHVVETEGPILDEVLARRIARMHGWLRTGTRIQARVENLATRTHLFSREEHGRFFWPKGLVPEEPFPPRKSWSALERSVEEVCLPELVALAREVIRLGGREASSVGTMARALGLNRVKSANRERLEQALTLAEQDRG